jgi:16S rRNA (guanine527-N7)-methyltransferase
MMQESVSRETAARFAVFAQIFAKWAKAVNLVAASTLDELETRHIADSLQIARFAPDDARNWVDFGTGGGFPGLIIAASQVETHPDRTFILVESDQRKCTFLREAARAMGITVKVITARIEDLSSLRADVISARALAPLELLCDYAHRHLAPQGVALFMKGEGYAKEVAMAKQAGWTFDLDYKASMTHTGSVIIVLRNIARDV